MSNLSKLQAFTSNFSIDICNGAKNGERRKQLNLSKQSD